MKAGICFLVAASLSGLSYAQPTKQQNSTYYNPILPGFHPDPSCVFVKEWDNTFFCASSTFLAFPGIPIHASKDLVNWKLIGHAFNRPEQLPAFNNITGQQNGWYAPTIRYHNKRFWIIDSCVGSVTGFWSTSDPYSNSAWTNVVPSEIPGYDPDLFWDTDGTVYSAFADTVLSDPFTTEIHQVELDVPSGNATNNRFLWNGTADVSVPEGPHMMLKDGYHYLLLAQGGTATGHQVTIGRGKSAQGPFEADPANPILTANGTDAYFQTVGHADLFQDAAGNWWGVALATRSGPEYKNWPMGRETVLFPARWDKGEWPIMDPVRGQMSGPLPPIDKSIKGTGAFIKDPDYYKFPPGSSIPSHFAYWRFPKTENYIVSPKGHPNTLRLLPSYANLTAYPSFIPTDGITFIGRRQTDSLFTYSVNIDYSPSTVGEESGVSLFLTQDYHADLGIVRLNGTGSYLRFRAHGSNAPSETVVPIPQHWCAEGIKLQIQAYNITHFSFSAGSQQGPVERIATVPATFVSNGFTGKWQFRQV